MKLKPFLISSLTSFIAYTAYHKRQTIKNSAKALKEQKDVIQFDLGRIKANVSLIQTEVHKLQDIGDDVSHKLKVFNQETQPLVSQIKDRMEKYQTEENENK